MPSKFDSKYLIKKVDSNERLSFEDGCNLLRSADIDDIRIASDHARRKIVGDKVCFIVNKHIYYSNVCVWRCKFCAFPCKPNDPDAYLNTPEKMLAEISETPFISEVRITGGVNPKLSVDYFCTLFELIKGKFPNIHIEALAPTEIDYLARLDNLTARDVLIRFKDAGLGSLAAGGAEVASERVRKIICPRKSTFSTWLEVSRIAHELGIMSNASIMYGHVETIEERVEHLLKIRDLQDETGGFNAFIPLKYIETEGSSIKSSITDSAEDLKMYALSRLLLDNFKHIKVLWLFNDRDTSRKALDFGADDIGGTVYEHKKGVARSAGSEALEYLSKDDMIQLILEADREPFERGALYEVKAEKSR